jgi:hypothetical protein
MHVWVAGHSGRRTIIGQDYLVASCCQVDLAWKLLYVGNDDVRLFNQPQLETSGSSRIVVQRTPAIPGMSYAVIPGRLDSCDKQRIRSVTEPMNSSNGKLLVARALVGLTAGNLPITVMNLTIAVMCHCKMGPRLTCVNLLSAFRNWKINL